MGIFNNTENEQSFNEAIETRRTIYNLEKTISISDEELEELIAHAVKHVPSAFNSQSTRIVLLLNDKNEQFWENTKSILKETMGPDRDFEPTRQKLIISNILMAQFFIMKIKVLLMHYKIKCLTSMKTLKFGQTKLTRCISMLFGLL